MEHTRLTALSLSTIHINDSYWNRYIELIPSVALPYQWDILNDAVPDAPPSFCLHNFKIAAGEAEGERQGNAFRDSDVAKWLEAVAYSLASHPDAKLEATADDVIALLGRAQCKDGYLNTYFTLVENGVRWRNLTEGHELYVAGHFIEAAVAYYESTGKKALLDIMCRNADLICSVFGPGEHQLHGCPGHPEIELALVRLYHTTGVRRYLELAKYFVDIRGQSPNYFMEEMHRTDFKQIFPEFSNYSPIYSQSHKPVREQHTAEGHAVRAVYLYCAMADLAQEYNDTALLDACRDLWHNIVNKRMYLTGSIGSSGFWERFTVDYDLPNSSNYSETCASIGLALFSLRMARILSDASYIDVIERILYNTVRSGISMEGNTYFYVNPLEVWPKRCLENTSDAHVKPVRQKWFDVACCPTNVARTLTSLGQYIYSADSDNLYLNLFIQNKTDFMIHENTVHLSLNTDFPRTGNITLSVTAQNTPFKLHLRIPSYAENWTVSVNGQPAGGTLEKGYYSMERVWNNDTVALQFKITPKFVYANPAVHANSGKIALVRGPEVYCLEETDNGADLTSVFVGGDTGITEQWENEMLGGTMLLHFDGFRLNDENGTISSVCTQPPVLKPTHLTAVPYGSWGNRKNGEMLVWMHALLV
ncbi:MAG TPA: beta-L-arabinofuranosidase domain-containing protein [Caproiciproducens sp.]|nr:beta-L-arabinofuranosidase domain-containing protein [Caproiciproducens sp.]